MSTREEGDRKQKEGRQEEGSRMSRKRGKKELMGGRR